MGATFIQLLKSAFANLVSFIVEYEERAGHLGMMKTYVSQRAIGWYENVRFAYRYIRT